MMIDTKFEEDPIEWTVGFLIFCRECPELPWKSLKFLKSTLKIYPGKNWAQIFRKINKVKIWKKYGVGI